MPFKPQPPEPDEDGVVKPIEAKTKEPKKVEKKAPVEVVDVEFEANDLHDGRLEFHTLVRCILLEELRARLWPRLLADHFVSDIGHALYTRLTNLLLAGKEWPSISIIAKDPALPQEVRQALEALLARADRNLPITPRSIDIAGNKVSLERDADFEHHVFDILESYRQVRGALEGYSECFKAIKDTANYDPLTGPAMVEKAALHALSMKKDSDLTPTLLHFGAQTTKEDDEFREQQLSNTIDPEANIHWKTGFQEWDEKSGGVQPGEVILMGSSPGGGKCLIGRTTAITGNGILTMEEVCSSMTKDGYQDVTMQVHGRKGLEPVAQLYRESQAKTIRIDMEHRYWNQGTAAHRIQVVSPKGIIKWRRHDRVKVGDMVLHMIGQDTWGTNTTIVINGVATALTEEVAKNCATQDFNARSERIPRSIRTAERKTVAAYVRQLRALHGKAGSHYVFFDVQHLSYAEDLRAVLNNFGIPNEILEDNTVKAKAGQFLRMSGLGPFDSDDNWYDQRPGNTTRRELRLQKYLEGANLPRRLLRFVDRNWLLLPVTKVTHVEELVTVYDLVVPGTHSFIANGLVQHNTASLLSLMHNFSEQGISCAMVQLELSFNQLNERNASNLAEVNSKFIRAGTASFEQKDKIRTKWRELHERLKAIDSRMTFYVPASATIPDVEMVLKSYRYKVWFIDYVNLLSEVKGKDGDDWRRLSDVIKEFKRIAKKQKIAIFCAVQVKFDPETGAVQLRYAEAMRDHADIVIAWYLSKEDRKAGVTWWRHVKARQYEPFDFQVKVELEHGKFSSFKATDVKKDGRKVAAVKQDIPVFQKAEPPKEPLPVPNKKPKEIVTAPEDTYPRKPTPKRKIVLEDDTDAYAGLD
jgi:replicative DNA helicase